MSWAEYALDPTEKDDLFALGGVLYEIKAKKELYADKTDTQIRELYLRREFPDITSFTSNVRLVIEKCWHLEYALAGDVLRDLREEGSPSRGCGRSAEPGSRGI